MRLNDIFELVSAGIYTDVFIICNVCDLSYNISVVQIQIKQGPTFVYFLFNYKNLGEDHYGISTSFPFLVANELKVILLFID